MDPKIVAQFDLQQEGLRQTHLHLEVDGRLIDESLRLSPSRGASPIIVDERGKMPLLSQNDYCSVDHIYAVFYLLLYRCQYIHSFLCPACLTSPNVPIPLISLHPFRWSSVLPLMLLLVSSPQLPILHRSLCHRANLQPKVS